MVAFTKFAAAAVLMTSFAAAAPVRTPDSLDERIECMSLGCTTPGKPHPYVGSVVHLEGSDVFSLSSDKVEVLANSDASKTLVKNSIVKKPLEEEAAVGEERQDPDHGKRDVHKQLEKIADMHSRLQDFPTLDKHEEAARPGTGDRSPLEKAEERLLNGLEHLAHDKHESAKADADANNNEVAQRPKDDRSPLEKSGDRLLNGLEHLTHEKHESAQHGKSAHSPL